MVDKAIAMFGSYVDAKFMRGLKVMRVSVDIPIEHSNDFLKMFGAPDGVNPVPVCIARLNEAGAYAPQESGLVGSATATEPRTPRGSAEEQDKPRTYTRSNLAGIKCHDPEFQSWLGVVEYGTDLGEPQATTILKSKLGIKSRKELDTDPAKGEAWDRLMTDYHLRSVVR